MKIKETLHVVTYMMHLMHWWRGRSSNQKWTIKRREKWTIERRQMDAYACYAQTMDWDNPWIALGKPWIHTLCNNLWIVCANCGSTLCATQSGATNQGDRTQSQSRLGHTFVPVLCVAVLINLFLLLKLFNYLFLLFFTYTNFNVAWNASFVVTNYVIWTKLYEMKLYSSSVRMM